MQSYFSPIRQISYSQLLHANHENFEKYLRRDRETSSPIYIGPVDYHQKSSLVGWNSVCQPRSRGGLDFRNVPDQNASFLMKIGYNLLSKENAL